MKSEEEIRNLLERVKKLKSLCIDCKEQKENNEQEQAAGETSEATINRVF